ncbi:hypothetical protein [Microbacterium sp.]|uniref:hypothetical protein n=1 Tax=Microbacterium sp. TaxID=51671 RepID=UPI0039E3222D
MTTATAADRSAPLTDDLLLEERIAFLLGRASVRQFWMTFLYADHVQSEVVMPCDDLPASPDEPLAASDGGTVANADALARGIAELMAEFGFAQAVFVWERPGDARVRGRERAWAHRLATACARHGATVRAQFLLHDGGVRILAPDDYL